MNSHLPNPFFVLPLPICAVAGHTFLSRVVPATDRNSTEMNVRMPTCGVASQMAAKENERSIWLSQGPSSCSPLLCCTPDSDMGYSGLAATRYILRNCNSFLNYYLSRI